MIHITKGMIPFWDDHLIDPEFTDAILSVNRPEKAGIVMEFDRPWESDGTDFFTIIKDGDIYRMYYEAWSLFDPSYNEGINVCYAESRDGINWERPNLGLHEFRGSKDNNILIPRINDNFTVMLDKNPGCAPKQRFKALMRSEDPSGYANYDPGKPKLSLLCLTSADGIRFEKQSVVSRGYQYDSQNSLHWNSYSGKYYCYFREVHHCSEISGSFLNETDIRGILVSESEDFINWSDPVPLNFLGSENYPLYTNCVIEYPYDPKYYIGFPTRYVERKGWTPNFDRLCGREKRLARMEREPRLGLATTDCVFMSSRDNLNWFRFDEACLTPGIESGLNWVYGDCYPALGGLIETPARFTGEPPELSIYVDECHWMPPLKVNLARYVYRRDGFASVKAGYRAKHLRTKPFTFEGSELMINFRTSARGHIILRVLDDRNIPVEGYGTCELFGDALDRTVDFDKPLEALNGKTVRFEFTMSDAELYALRFR